MEAIITFSTGQIITWGIIAIWELVWKGIALWKSAQRKQNVWFILILILSTVGILPIIYLLIYRNKSSKKKARR